MRLQTCCARLLSVAFVVSALSGCEALSQKPSTTEARTDGFLDQVESAVTDERNYGFDFNQPEGPGIVIPAGFKVLEFDREGTRTKAGENLPDGKFFGEVIRNDRDDDRRIKHRVYTDYATGNLSHEDWFGPYGPVRSDIYIEGKLFQRALISYDNEGHPNLRTIEDGKGNALESRVIKMSKDGQVEKESTVGHEGGELFDEEIDNKNNSHSFDRFSEAGKQELHSSIEQGKVDSFWAASNRRNQWGSNSTSFASHSDAYRTSCANNGCSTAHIHYEYVDEAQMHPLSAEWKDAGGKLLYAAYYEYVFDSHKNWIRRDVWIVSPDHPVQRLYETDTRMITYWNR